MEKKFKLGKEQIQTIVVGYGGCFASDMITVDGHPVGFFYREEPDNGTDSGWRFMAGMESDEYLDDPENFEIHDVNTIVNYDMSIAFFLDASVGSAFERDEETQDWTLVEDWAAEAEE